jgi:DNA-binding CsgD family transcriptional regulator
VSFVPGPVLVLVVDPESTRELPESLIRKVLGLTPAETRLVLALARGHSIREHAEAAKITIGTARHHLKQALDKSGTHRQAQLVRLVLSSLAGSH